ncbi:MBL fold metallo-hydrolase [Corynebacterium uropygiale]|uniref:MBL fold metallo-hydrolase n=1 Tax=Corynebacterium uropygiale TaxID=1775911 RepID=A0A9X1QS43_9CORY|nr:MBL fold metallo-hydrolase [Corynebacterium uropygiale]MCF4006539.1 MBL fold metallo-hydrolase [Corynebacterium uropygiale]
MELLSFSAGPYATNCYVVVNEEEGCVGVVDPGLHAAPQIEALLKEKNLRLSDIVLTHGHIDHTRDAGQLAAAHGLPVSLHEADHPMLSDPHGGVSAEAAQLFDTAHMTPIEDLRALGETVELAGLPLEVIHAPGHSPGCVMLRSGTVCFSGDVLFRGSIGRTDLPGSDPDAMMRSLREKVLPLADDVTILPGHGAPSTMAQERRSNPFLLQLG